MRDVESLYLHVDVENVAAISLYEQAGYRKVCRTDMYLEFTTSLNLHDGATKGRKHFLMCKHLITCPTWLPLVHEKENSIESSKALATTATDFSALGTLGFEISCAN